MNKFIDIPENLIIGIPEIDDWHFEIAEIMNRLYEKAVNMNNLQSEMPGRDHSCQRLSAMQCVYGRNPPQREVTHLLDRLVKATRAHFQSEEEIMLALAFKGLPEHRREHLMLSAELSVLVRRCNCGIEPVGGETLKSLKHWFLGHLSGSDYEIGRHYRKMKIIEQ